MRPKDNRTDNQCGHGRDKDSSCRDIFSVAHQGVKRRRSCIGEEFESGVKSLGGPDNGDSQDNPAPVSWGYPKEEGGGQRNGRGCDVNPGVVLTADHPEDASDRVAEAANAARKLKRPTLGWMLRFGVVLHRAWFKGTKTQESGPGLRQAHNVECFMSLTKTRLLNVSNATRQIQWTGPSSPRVLFRYPRKESPLLRKTYKS
jgi:hypothetical protein